MNRPTEVKPFWFCYESEIPVAMPQAEDLRDGWRETIREHTRMAMRAARAAGRKVSGNVPFGWDEAEGGRLVPNDAEQAVVDFLRRRRAEGASFRDLVRELEADHVPTKSGLLTWTPATVRGVLLRSGQLGRRPSSP